MLKLLFPATVAILMVLMACTGATPTPERTEAAVSTSASTTARDPVPTEIPPQKPVAAATALPTNTPAPVTTINPSPTLETPVTPTATKAEVPESPTPAPTQTSPTVTPSATPAQAPDTPTPTPDPTPTPELTATAAPTATATPVPTPTPEPTATAPPAKPEATWRGITVAPEDRCSPYDPDDYPYPQSVEPRIVEELGGIYGPYTGNWFETIRETDIEHIVARSEAHDSGLCAVDAGTKAEFASDILNLTLASPSVNRHQKVAKDPAEWLPELNGCWYVDRVIQVRREYGLTINRAEAEAIDGVLAGCESTELVVLAPGRSVATATPTPGPDVDALDLWDDNGNGRITCAEARAHGIAPVLRGHPAYEFMNDRDGDGVVCE